MAVQLQKYLLRQLLGYAAVVQEVVSQAENHALLLPNDIGERGQIALRRRFAIFPHANCCSSRANRCHALLIDILRAEPVPECSIFAETGTAPPQADYRFACLMRDDTDAPATRSAGLSRFVRKTCGFLPSITVLG